MIYFVFIQFKILFFFHCKGGGTTFKRYILEKFLKKRFKNIDFDKLLQKHTIHDILRKYRINEIVIDYVKNNDSINFIKKKYNLFKMVYIHRNYQERLVSCFYNKVVDLDDNGVYFKKVNVHKTKHNNFTYSEFIHNICHYNIKDVHWNYYPKNFTKLDFELIELKNLSDLNIILKKQGMETYNFGLKNNTTNENLIQSNDPPDIISVQYILDLRKNNEFIPHTYFYNEEINNQLKNKYSHEIIK